MPVVNSENDFFDMVSTGPMFGRTPQWKILVEGDSWVSHPFLGNLAIQLDMLGEDEFAILNLAVPGDTAGNMFRKGRKQLKIIDRVLYNERFGYDFDMIFISAAGNDIVGEEIRDFVDDHGTQNRHGADLINKRFDRILRDVVKGYENLIRIRNKSRINKTTPIVTHVYCYLTPQLVGTKVFGAMFGEGWIKRYLDEKNIPQHEQELIVRAMLDRFHDALKALEQKYTGFIVVNTRRTLLKRSVPDAELWHDELHPTGRGFKKIAAAIKKQSIVEGVWPS